MKEENISLNPYQAEFLHSQDRYPALVASIGTGKTYMLLLKCWNFCKEFKDSLALIVRNEFTDLKDSTMSDFEKYFSVKIHSDKSFTFPNGSKILFRHASEINVLKNLNLNFIGIEQAEEFENEETFDFLRDRLRRQTSPYRQFAIIANARGHNWIWQRWIQSAKAEEIDPKTGQYFYLNGEYMCCTANSFANEHNLPADFMADLRSMEYEAPNHYKQFVLNSFEDVEEDDLLFSFQELDECREIKWLPRTGYGMRIGGFDLARYGNDKCACVIIEQMGALKWRVMHVEQWEKKDLAYTTGRITDIKGRYKLDEAVLDGDGMGGGPIDVMISNGIKNIIEFRNKPFSRANNDEYGNERTKAYFRIKEYIQKNWIAGFTEEMIQELLTVRYEFMPDGRRRLISKEKMRKDGIKSPNIADALCMALSRIGLVKAQQDNQYRVDRQYSQEGNLFAIGGIR